MAEESFPVVEQPMSAEQWSEVTKGMGDGILDDGGQPYRLYDIDNVDNGAKVGVDRNTGKASAILRGFYHRMDHYEIVRFPAVSSPTTYYVGLEYDPLRMGSGDLPVKLGVWTNLDYSSGKFYLINYTVERKPDQILSDAKITNTTRKVAPTFTVDSFDSLPEPERVQWGSLALVTPNNGAFKWYQARRAEAGTERLAWVLIADMSPEPVAIPYPATRKYPGHGSRLSILREGTKRTLFGRIAIESGAAFTPVDSGNDPWWLFNFPAEDRPARTYGSLGQVAGFVKPGYARLESTADGQLFAAPTKTTSWIGVDGFTYFVK